MADPFTFRWGARRLVGLGVDIQADQAAVTTEEGFALAVIPVSDPQMPDAWCPLYDEEGDVVVAPIILKTTLNYPIQMGDDVIWTAQDYYDHHMGPQWRHVAQGVGTLEAGPRIHTVSDDGDDLIKVLWSCVGISPEDAVRMGAQIHHIWDNLKYDEVACWIDRAQQQEYARMGWQEYEYEDDTWEQACERLGADPNKAAYEQEITLTNEEIFPSWKFDPDLQRTWDTLLTSSKRNWHQMAKMQKPRERSSWLWSHKRENPWLSSCR